MLIFFFKKMNMKSQNKTQTYSKKECRLDQVLILALSFLKLEIFQG